MNIDPALRRHTNYYMPKTHIKKIKLIQKTAKKYWLLTTEYPPLHGGGISTYCFFTSQMFAENGYLVTVFVIDDTIKKLFISVSGNIRLIRFNPNTNNLRSFLGYTARISYAFATVVIDMISKEGKPDFIEAQDYLGIAYYITQFKYTGYILLKDIPIIITLHSPAFIYLEYNRVPTNRFPDYWTGEMEKNAIIAADALISPTNFLIEEISKHISLTGKQIGIIANPYKIDDVSNFEFIKNKIIYYGKLSPQKGSFELLEYFKELWDEGFSYPLTIIGSTDIVYYPEMKTMGQIINKKYALYIAKGLLKFSGKIPPSKINESIKDAHVIIVPSIVDNMPYVVMEAMCIGKVVLASIQGGQKEMIDDGKDGLLFNHNEPITFKNQLNNILSLDKEQIINIGYNARQRVKDRYSFEHIINQKVAFIEQINNTSINNFPFLHQETITPVIERTFVKELLSIIIPFYNLGNYIEECVNSVLTSSYKNIEILIIDDGSTDEPSTSKLKLLAKIDKVTIIKKSNTGLAETRNYGANIAKGEFLAFIDADDKVQATYYEKAITALNYNDNVFFVGSWVKYFENSSNVWPTFTPQPPYALIHNPINSSGLVYKKNAFLTSGGNDKKVDYGMEDYESVIQMLKHGFNGVVLPETLFYYRVRSGSMFRNITTAKLLYSNKYISEKHKLFYAKFAVQIINLLNANGPGYLYDNPTFEINISARINTENFLFFRFKNFVKKHNWLKKLVLTLKQLKF